MKKILPFIIVFLIAMVAWDALFDPSGMEFIIDGEQLHGPGGAILTGLLASGGMLIALVVLVLVAVILAVVFAGLGVLAVLGLVLGAVLLALLASPLLLPLLIPAAIIWYVAKCNRRHRVNLEKPAVAA